MAKYRCPICRGSSFSSNAEVLQHVARYHIKKNVKVNYVCPDCNKHFMTFILLSKHRVVCKSSVSSSTCRELRGTLDSRDIPSTSHHTVRHGDGLEAGQGGVADKDALSHQESSQTDFLEESQAGFEDLDMDTSSPFFCDSAEDNPQDQGNQSSVEPELECEEEGLSQEIEDVLQHEVGLFITYLKDSCYASQKIINEVIKGTDRILDIYLDWVKSRLSKEANGREILSLAEAASVLQKMKGLSIFQGAHDSISVLEDTGKLVKPEKVVFKTRQVLMKNGVEEEDLEFAYKVPFLPQLESLLHCEDVLKCVDHPQQAAPGTYASILDGSFYRNHPVVVKDPKALGIVLHIDGAEMSDSASPRAGLNNLTNISWVLANIHPKLRSTDKTINLLATIRTIWLTPARLEVLLQDLIEAMKKLSSDGVTFSINSSSRIFYGMLLAVLGDYPALAYIGGFKETVKASTPCRRCLAPNPDYLHVCDISVFPLRTMESHAAHLKEVEEYIPPPGPRPRHVQGQPHPDPSVRYGVNRRSPLMSVPYFDVTSCLLQDVMHLGPEGLLGFVCRRILCHVVLEKKKKLLTEINDEISVLGKYLRCDRPSPRNMLKHLHKGLRQSAAQMNNLAILLPFVLRKDSSFAGDDVYLHLLIRLIRILNLCMAFSLKSEDAERLSEMISSFHEELLKLEPEISMGKVHFLHHLPEQIHTFGVIRQQACYRFESHFAVLKRIARLIHNTKNLSMSLAFRHQTKQCQAMVQSNNFLYSGHEFGKRQTVPITACDTSLNMLKEHIQVPFKEIEEVSKVTVHGATFQANKSSILINSKSNLPKFAKILKIFFINKKHIGFFCQEMKTVCEDMELNAYNVILQSKKTVIALDNMEFPHEVLLLKFEDKSYVIPKGHRELLT